MQAYSLTHTDIIDALIKAKKRGLIVKILLDKSNLITKHSIIKRLKENNIQVKVDNVRGIAHNKIIIVDKIIVITGSFNFTKAADNRNSENIIVIKDRYIASQYFNNWLFRDLAN